MKFLLTLISRKELGPNYLHFFFCLKILGVAGICSRIKKLIGGKKKCDLMDDKTSLAN